MANRLMDTIPATIRSRIRQLRVVEAAFAAGPGLVAGSHERFEEPIGLESALRWLQAHAYRTAHVVLEDGTRLWFGPDGFSKLEPGRPRGV